MCLSPTSHAAAKRALTPEVCLRVADLPMIQLLDELLLCLLWAWQSVAARVLRGSFLLSQCGDPRHNLLAAMLAKRRGCQPKRLVANSLQVGRVGVCFGDRKSVV